MTNLKLTSNGGQHPFGLGNQPATTTTNTFMLLPSRKLESSKFIQKESGNYIEMVFRETPSQYSTTGTLINLNPTEILVKEIYGVSDGKLQLLNTIKGKEKPGYYVPASIEWEE